VLPIVVIYRKYYGARFAWRITALLFVTMVVAALILQGLFSVLGLIPSGPRPTRNDVFGSLAVNYKLVLNLAALVMFWLTRRRGGASDPSCPAHHREPILSGTAA
jgi:hypothetical protein